MRVLSLFDGCSGARQALDNLGIECEYFASEIDQYAMQIANKNFPDTIQLGDITKLNESNLPKNIDLMIGGFPCTSLSCASGQRESGLTAGESMLFWEFVRVLKIVQPKYFIGENVASMKDHDQNEISNILGYSPIYINSAKLVAQNRQRYYWCNFHVDPVPERYIVIKDILDPVIDSKYFLSKSQYSKISWKSSDSVLGTLSDHQGDRIFDINGKSSCLSANGGNNAGGGCNLIAVSNLVGGVGKGKQGQRIYATNGKSPALIASNQELYVDNYLVRRLTPSECEKLQGIKPGYTEGVSDTQRYKMIGNGFTIPIIEHLIKSALKNGVDSNDLGVQVRLPFN